MPYYRKRTGNYKRTGKQQYVARIKNKRYAAKRYTAIEAALRTLPKSIKNKIKGLVGTRKYTNRRGAIQRRRKQMNYYKKRVLAKNPRFAIKERAPRYNIPTKRKRLDAGRNRLAMRYADRVRARLAAKKKETIRSTRYGRQPTKRGIKMIKEFQKYRGKSMGNRKFRDSGNPWWKLRRGIERAMDKSYRGKYE